jgi:predicted nucleotidyltransferase component of viral defense system
MITTARQLKDLIRNLSKKKSADAQILVRNYMMERFLERISLSEYKNQFILKGGMLVAAMVGLDARATMDLDATIKGTNVSVEDVEMIISKIISIPLNDGVSFRIKRISEIMEEADYPGVRVSMETKFDGVITPLKIDISTGDIITPREIKYNFNLMLENRTIEVWAYNLETVLAEKLETVISRNVTNTRMRDFYDIYILQKLYGEQLSKDVLRDALVATAKKRETLEQIETEDIDEVFDEIQSSSVMENLWKAYQRNYSYSADIPWHTIMKSIRTLYEIISKNTYNVLQFSKNVEKPNDGTTKQGK